MSFGDFNTDIDIAVSIWMLGFVERADAIFVVLAPVAFIQPIQLVSHPFLAGAGVMLVRPGMSADLAMKINLRFDRRLFAPP